MPSATGHHRLLIQRQNVTSADSATDATTDTTLEQGLTNESVLLQLISTVVQGPFGLPTVAAARNDLHLLFSDFCHSSVGRCKNGLRPF